MPMVLTSYLHLYLNSNIFRYTVSLACAEWICVSQRVMRNTVHVETFANYFVVDAQHYGVRWLPGASDPYT